MVALLFSNASQVALIDLNASNYKICLVAIILEYDDYDDLDDADDDNREKSAAQRKEAPQPCEELLIRAACAFACALLCLCFYLHTASTSALLAHTKKMQCKLCMEIIMSE